MKFVKLYKYHNSIYVRSLLIFLLFLRLTSFAYSQIFSVNVVDNSQLVNTEFQFDISNNSESEQFICIPTHNIDQYFENTYTDIAIDHQNNVYYVSAWGSLYRKNHNDSSCEFLGKFDDYLGTINSMVADSNKFIYAAGNLHNVSYLYKYDIELQTFETLGNIPSYIATGDLFFYNNRLFLAALDTSTSKSCIIEINMVDTQQSCYFMDLNNINVYGAFSVNYGNYSKAYILTEWTLNTESSSLIEIDMENKEIGDVIRTYDHIIYGAATFYDLTSTDSMCKTMNNTDLIALDFYFNITNPSSENILFTTDIDFNKIEKIKLFDFQGKEIRTFKNINTNSLDISSIEKGMYLLQVHIRDYKTLTKKIIIK